MLRHHLENVDYIPGRTQANLKDAPEGVKLYCEDDGPRCKVLCVSCHFPMEKVGERMKIERGFGNCMRCHS